MIFDCPNRKECEEMGVLVDSDCKVYCGLYENHRVKQIEQVAKEMYGSMRRSYEAGKAICMEEMHEAIVDLEALGVSLDD